MNKLGNKVCLILIFMVMCSCFSNKFEYIGEKQVVNKEDWIVKFYQKDEFEMFTPVIYEVFNGSKKLTSERRSLTGADANLQNVNNFYVKMQDSIFYICYPYPIVVAIKDVSNMDKQNQ
ncbi:hypothetical protein R5N98_09045 [Tenacibaculum maritimum]|uniref:hypothetical protein n=1 Tax=Tenacibaculum maritimum TaxID=107401 RepID=UPI0038762416